MIFLELLRGLSSVQGTKIAVLGLCPGRATTPLFVSRTLWSHGPLEVLRVLI